MKQEIDVPFQQKLAKLMVLTDLLVTEFDNNVLKLEEAKLINEKLTELQPLFLTILDAFYNNVEVQKTTFYSKLAEKFEYNYTREFHKYFKIKLR